MIHKNLQTGFSAIELLITLVIASLFIIMGFQLYSVSIENGGEARREAAASALAYKKLRQMTTAGTGVATCLSTSTVTTANVDNNKAVQTTTISCPYPTPTYPVVMSKIRLATVKVKYNVSGTEVSHAMYITEN